MAEAIPLTQDAVTKMIADAVGAAVKPLSDALAEATKNQKVIADTLAAEAKAKADAEKIAADKAKADKDKPVAGAEVRPLTAEQVAQQVKDGIAAALAAQQTAAQSTAQREAFIADKLKGVPKAYQSQLGADPTKWAAEEQAIRGQVQADLKAMGVTVKDVSGGSGGTTTAETPEGVSARLKAAGLSDGEAAFAASLKL